MVNVTLNLTYDARRGLQRRQTILEFECGTTRIHQVYAGSVSKDHFSKMNNTCGISYLIDRACSSRQHFVSQKF
jgi:hypothetical protein